MACCFFRTGLHELPLRRSKLAIVAPPHVGATDDLFRDLLKSLAVKVWSWVLWRKGKIHEFPLYLKDVNTIIQLYIRARP